MVDVVVGVGVEDVATVRSLHVIEGPAEGRPSASVTVLVEGVDEGAGAIRSIMLFCAITESTSGLL